MNKRCILFVHGLGGNTDDTWGELRDILHEKKRNKLPEYNGVEFKYFEYESSKLTSIDGLSIKAIRSLFGTKDDAASLPSQILQFSKLLTAELSKADYLVYENVSIVSHSMGGLISCKYLLDEIYHSKSIKVDRVLYICTPFLGSVFSNAADKLGIASAETRDMVTGSELLMQLFRGVDDIKDKVNATYYFGDKDEVIENYVSSVSYDNQTMLKGDHSSILSAPNLEQNFDHIERFILGESHKTFIEMLYSGAISNRKLSYENVFRRKITKEETLRKFQGNHLQDSLLNGREYMKYSKMIEIINNHHFSPHNEYNGERYYVNIKGNENILDKYWLKIKEENKVPPCFYIGYRGSGKTLIQNVWINKHFEEMEKSKIFHVRCDVHKIYHLMQVSDPEASHNNLKIEDYLDMQFLYIYLKYRSSEFNVKGSGNEGVRSCLMKDIDLILDKGNPSIIEGSKFNNLGDFLDKQSNNIKHNEVNLRDKNRRYSYALELMGNISSDEKIRDILGDYESIFSSIINSGSDPRIEEFLGSVDKNKRYELIDRITDKARKNELKSKKIKASDMQTTLLEIEEEITKNRRNTTSIWLRVSKFVQDTLLSNDYKILKIVDGIDNIIIQDTTKDRNFYENKVEEIRDIVARGNTFNVFYFISLRSDSFIEIENKIKSYESNSVVESIPKYIIYRHQNASESLGDIISRRYDACINLNPKLTGTSLYDQILHFIFKEYKRDFSNRVINFNNIRAILRHYLFISLHVLFDFRRTRKKFDKDRCKKIIDRVFDEVFFLRTKLYIKTEETTGDKFDYKYKVFPNIFYTHHRSDKWTGLCRLRILQLLNSNNLSKEDIANKLSVIYPIEYTKKKIENLLGYNLIESDFDEKIKKIIYKTTDKGNYLLEIVRSNLNILYYMCLDTPLPTKFVNEENDFSAGSYLSVFSRTGVLKNTGYGNSIIKSVLTFVLFVKSIHDLEMQDLSKGDLAKDDLSKFVFPLDLVGIELNMKNIYSDVVENHTQLDSYFKNIGNYQQADLDRYLGDFSWSKSKSYIYS